MIYLISDVLSRSGGIESYLHALSLKLLEEGIRFRVGVCEGLHCPLLDDLTSKGVSVFRVPHGLGDRFGWRRRALYAWLRWQLQPKDLVFCVRQPMEEFYQPLVKMVHGKGARLAVSWMLTPEFIVPNGQHARAFKQAVAETDIVISVSRAGVPQYREVYDHDGPVSVVPYHNLLFFEHAVPLPGGPPWKLGFLGRLDVKQKNLDRVLLAYERVARELPVEFHFFGRGSVEDRARLTALAAKLGIASRVSLHGEYDHTKDLPGIIGSCHLFTYLSSKEGGPCFTLLELMQAGRYCIASDVGGIPDLYAGREELGLLVPPNDQQAMVSALRCAIAQLERGAIRGEAIREFYLNNFSMDVAHAAWTEALGQQLEAVPRSA
jgi:glycosyltransferase involved in cell wall biosynthesis